MRSAFRLTLQPCHIYRHPFVGSRQKPQMSCVQFLWQNWGNSPRTVNICRSTFDSDQVTHAYFCRRVLTMGFCLELSGGHQWPCGPMAKRVWQDDVSVFAKPVPAKYRLASRFNQKVYMCTMKSVSKTTRFVIQCIDAILKIRKTPWQGLLHKCFHFSHVPQQCKACQLYLFLACESARILAHCTRLHSRFRIAP